jgi:aminoglycoside phosphotransferase family enzyme
MSWVFAADDIVYKLKKPVHFAYLDFSTLDKREAACRAELTVNRQLAPGVYVGVAPLTLGPGGMTVAGEGTVVDWLIVMHRLDKRSMLDRALLSGSLDCRELDRFVDTLADFYRHADRVPMSPARLLGEWRAKLADNRRVIFSPRFELNTAILTAIDRVQRRFLTECAPLLVERARQHCILEGHGDLRPEHISIGVPIAIIDRIEFSRRFRTVDPFDELAALAVECDLIGTRWAGEYIAGRVAERLHETISPVLFAFYRCYRAMLRAGLVVAHLLEPDGRTPEKWPRLSRQYLALAAVEAGTLAACLDAQSYERIWVTTV